ncbi:hypothetical protein [Calothrix sp. UHCC 0171]|uniref:hypothetical protein n=1 Tax=Calothrix sp. UHCC 0171 TaxID=3110245 RepID=UPI002B214650|nr:hypothetical protein [Calothrix sp. UHCC 0171]MEA5572501.1 hypothetical protein [Calothrix sp. UHCC 0171]
MRTHKLITGTFLVLSIVSTSLLGITNIVQAGEGKCGDSAAPCQENQIPNQPTISIKYTIENKTDKIIKFALPTGKIYELAPGQKASYQNTLPANRLRLFIVGTGKQYPLKNGNYQFRKDRSGKILLARVTAPRRVTTRLNPAISFPNRSRTRVFSNLPGRVGTPTEKKPNPTDTATETQEPEAENPDLANPETPDLESSDNSQSNSTGLEIIREIAGIVKTAITADAETEQKRIETLGHQGIRSDNSNSASENAEELATNPNSLPGTPPSIVQVGNSADEILAKWGWTKVDCDSGNSVVILTGLSNSDVCVNPTSEIPAGKYEYNRTSHQLTPVNQQ